MEKIKMSDDQKIPSGDALEASGQEEKSVSYETYLKTVNQEKKLRERLKEHEAVLNELRQKEEAEREAKLAEEGKWREALEFKNQKLADAEQRVKDLEDKFKTTEQTLMEGYKLQAVLEKLPSKPKKKEFYSFIDTSKVLTDPETGDFDERSIEDAANSFLSEYGTDLLDMSRAKRLPNDAANPSSSKLSIEEWRKLPLKERKARMNEVYKNNT